jgi:aryl-alcohol dehydrogenase-like predicted oxidoreductase
LHAVDELVPFEDSVGELHGCRRPARSAHRVVEHHAGAARPGAHIVDVVSVQNRYNVADRYSNRCSRLQRAGSHSFRGRRCPAIRTKHRRRRAALEVVAARRAFPSIVPRSRGCWPFARDAADPGTSHRAHLDDNVAAASVTTASEMTEIG